MNANMNKMMKQVQKMQNQIAKLQEEMKTKTVEATSGGGAVTVVATGGKEIVEIKIDPDALDDAEMVQDLVMTAVNESLRKADEMMNNEMQKVTGGMNLPPGMF